MPLQIRLVHALGDRLVELDSSASNEPLVVGRSPEAFISIPAVNISRRHCLLYRHEGQWVIADAASAGGTFVNGERLVEPAYLNFGDVVTLGTEANPPRLIVDPLGVGKRSSRQQGNSAAANPMPAEPSDDWEHPPAVLPALAPAPRRGPMPIHGGGGGAAAGAGAADGYAAPGQEASAAPSLTPAEPETVDPVAEEWPMAAAPTLPRGYRPTPTRKSNPAVAIVIVVGVGLLLIGAVAYVLMHREHPSETLTVIPTATASVKPAAKKPIFEGLPDGADPHNQVQSESDAPAGRVDSSPPKPAMANPAPVEKPAPADKPTPAAAPASPAAAHVGDVEWPRVAEAHDMTALDAPEMAIVVYNDYLARSPKAASAAEVRAYIDEAVDRLWWLRIDTFCQQRDDLRAQLKTKKEEIGQESDVEFKKKLLKEKQELTDQTATIDAQLKDLNYTDATRLDLNTPEVVASLRKARDPKAFEKFKTDCLNQIKRTRAALPWHAVK